MDSQFCNPSTRKYVNAWKGCGINFYARGVCNAKVLSSIVPACSLKYIRECIRTDVSLFSRKIISFRNL